MARRWSPVLLLVGVVAGCSAATVPTVDPSSSVLTSSPSPPAPATAPGAPNSAPSGTPTAAPSPSAGSAPAAAWRRLDPDRPPAAREDHTWTVEAGTRVAYLFGGRDGPDVFGDLWAFDLASDTWHRLQPSGPGPQPRFGHEAVWVDGAGLVVWAGQAGPTTFFDDLWAYDPATNDWDRLANDGARPVARYGSCSALGPDGRLWISHGFTAEGRRFADTRAYDFATGRWADVTPDGPGPVERCLHACWFSADQRLALYAGQTTGVPALGDLWLLDAPGAANAQWSRVETPSPAERQLYALAPYGDGVVLFGARGPEGPLREVHAVGGSPLAFEEVRPAGARPSARSGATLVADPAGSRVVLFGGTSTSRRSADTWELTLPPSG